MYDDFQDGTKNTINENLANLVKQVKSVLGYCYLLDSYHLRTTKDLLANAVPSNRIKIVECNLEYFTLMNQEIGKLKCSLSYGLIQNEIAKELKPISFVYLDLTGYNLEPFHSVMNTLSTKPHMDDQPPLIIAITVSCRLHDHNSSKNTCMYIIHLCVL
jgi:hypothetical protein